MMMYWRENFLLPIRLIERRKMALKKAYEAPMLEIEEYCLDTSIAANCQEILNDRDMVCYDKWMDQNTEQPASLNTSFDDDGTQCDCYYQAGGQGFFAS